MTRPITSAYLDDKPSSRWSGYAWQALFVASVVGLVWARQLWPKAEASHWTRLGPSWATVPAVSITPDGSIFAVGNRLHATVYASRDHGATFGAWPLDTKTAWRVVHDPYRDRTCAGLEDGIACWGATGLVERRQSEHGVYWIEPLASGVLFAGYPGIDFAPDGDLDRATRVFTTGKAVRDGAHSTDGRLWAVGEKLWMSEDEGRSFQTRWSPPDEKFLDALAVRGERVYVAGGLARDGLFRSDDGGQTFERLVAPIASPDSLLIPTDDPDVVVLGTSGDLRPGDAYLSRDGDHTWKPLGCPGVSIVALATDGHDLFCGSGRFLLGDGLWRRPLADALAP